MRGDLLGRAMPTALFAGALALVSCAGETPPPTSPDPALATPPPADASAPAAASAAAAPAPPASPGAPTSSDTGADGGNSNRGQDEIKAIVQNHRPKFRACYDEARKRAPSLRGWFVIDFTLNPDGTLREATYARDKSEIKDEAMGQCALAALKTIGFPPSKVGKETKISYPFGFTPGGGGSP
jgi:outer membrane biosynthesis protein TonB